MRYYFSVFLISLVISTYAQAQQMDLRVNPSSVGTASVGQVPAIQNNSAACTTCVGYSGYTTINNFGNLTSQPVTQSLVSVSLPPGDYLVSGAIQYAPANTTVIAYAQSSINTDTGCSTPSVNAAIGGSWAQPILTASPGVSTGGLNFSATLPEFRISLNATTTVCITSSASFTTSTLGAQAKLSVIRIR